MNVEYEQYLNILNIVKNSHNIIQENFYNYIYMNASIPTMRSQINS